VRILSDAEREDYLSSPGWKKYKGKCPTCLDTNEYVYRGDTYECADEDGIHQQRELWKLYSLARLKEEHCRLDWDEYPMEDVKGVIDQYIRSFQSNLIMGTGLTIAAKAMGIGKTWAAIHVLQELLKADYDCFFVTFWDLKDYEDRSHVRRLRENHCVVIDDVLKPYTEAQTPFYEDKLEEVLRYRTMSNLPTIVTTNMTDEEFDDKYSRVHSLLRGKQIEIQLGDTSDHRMREAEDLHEDWRLSSMQGEVWPLR
jgi:DNA replication protein DnaC